MNDILTASLKRSLPQTQDECVAIGVRDSLARYGELPADLIPPAMHGLVRGLFGPAYISADIDQRLKWYKMAKHQYKLATNA